MSWSVGVSRLLERFLTRRGVWRMGGRLDGEELDKTATALDSTWVHVAGVWRWRLGRILFATTASFAWANSLLDLRCFTHRLHDRGRRINWTLSLTTTFSQNALDITFQTMSSYPTTSKHTRDQFIHRYDLVLRCPHRRGLHVTPNQTSPITVMPMPPTFFHINPRLKPHAARHARTRMPPIRPVSSRVTALSQPRGRHCRS